MANSRVSGLSAAWVPWCGLFVASVLVGSFAAAQWDRLVGEAPQQFVNGARDSAKRSEAAAVVFRDAQRDGVITLNECLAVEAARSADEARR